MTTIDQFFAGSRYAVVGTDPRHPYGEAIVQSLSGGGRSAYVVYPDAAPRAGSTRVYASLREVPESLDGAIFNIENDPQRMLSEVQLAIELGVRRIWIENRCEAREAVAYALTHGAEVVDNVCPLMVLDPHHIHWIHRKALDVFHKTPVVQLAAPAPGSAP
ncbi:MAG TPA: CoA-binding protein [Chloroflexota bacterium]|nr:CoA-binding protein [Chloroflexota bacterium]